MEPTPEGSAGPARQRRRHRNPDRLPAHGHRRAELEIVHWRAAGLSNREVGEVVGLSEKRIKNIVTRIFLKLGTSQMEETISLLHRSGVLRHGTPPLADDRAVRQPHP